MGSKGLGRRAFLARASAGIAGAMVGASALGQMSGGGMGGGGMGGGGVVDPPVGARLADPPVAPNASGAAGIVDTSIDARIATVSVNGTPADLLTYNGSFIAPTIRARQGDLVRLHFVNDLPYTTERNLLGHQKNVTNVHVHGWHVSPGNNMDGFPADNVHVLVPAGGGAQDYEYDLSMQRPGTLALYHPHVHGTVAEQFWGGLVGALDLADDLSVAKIPFALKSLTVLVEPGSLARPCFVLQRWSSGGSLQSAVRGGSSFSRTSPFGSSSPRWSRGIGPASGSPIVSSGSPFVASGRTGQRSSSL